VDWNRGVANVAEQLPAKEKETLELGTPKVRHEGKLCQWGDSGIHFQEDWGEVFFCKK